MGGHTTFSSRKNSLPKIDDANFGSIHSPKQQTQFFFSLEISDSLANLT